MFLTFFKSELAFWSKSLMLWIFLVVSTILVVTILTAQDPILDDVLFGNSFRNSPFVIQRLYGMMAVFGCLMVTAFVNSAATRDFTCKTAPLIFTKPIGKYSYLMGRFWAAMFISLIPMLGVSLAVFFSQAIMPGPQWGPTLPSAHFMCVLIFALPNTFLLASIVFSIAVWTRSALASFLGILGMMVFITISTALTTTLGGEFLGAFADPFGDSALVYMSKYWTVADKNTNSVDLTGVLLWNRVLWVAIGFVFLVAGCLRFSFTTRLTLFGRIANSIRATAEEAFAAPFHTNEIPTVSQYHSGFARVRQLIHMTLNELWVTLKSPVFICMMFGVFLSVTVTLSMRNTIAFGLSSLPVTFLMVELIQDSLEQFLIVLITFYAGVFVWKERDSNLDEILDACPTPTWLPLTSKLVSLLSIVLSVVVFGLVCGVAYQVLSGFYDIQIPVYVMEMLVLGMVNLSCLTILAVFCHVVSPNKYVGYFVFVAIMVANAVVWPWLGISTYLLNFGNLPNYVYSDLFGRAPYAAALRWFGLYWMSFAGLMSVAAILLWPRGCESGIQKRLSAASTRLTPGLRIASFAMIVVFASCTAWIYWNTQVRNTYTTMNENKIKQARYERAYRQLSDQPQPRVTDIRYEIDIYPKTRGLMMRGDVTIENKETEPVSTIFVFTNQDYQSEVEIEGATLGNNDLDAGMLTFNVEPPMAPGTRRQLKFIVTHETDGFENDVSVPQLVQNGTFLNSFIAPQVGYQPYAELKDIKDREKHGLPSTVTVALDPTNMKARRNSYLSSNSDWVNIETVISTSDDQIAIAPGSLLKKWKKDGRRYFHYKLDRPSANFYAFVSARYKVAVNHWNGIDIEVYHHPSHDWNVNLMLRSVRESLKYYSEAFGPYQHKQARIVEFPRVAEFAQAFPGTMPYGESMGFIADLQDPNDIDMVFYVVAHEIAHQWWAHQVIGANMQGATLLSETLAQYSALMVMEKEYGRDQMRKFLKYEMDNYLRARGREKNKELPLSQVQSNQGYIHYNKGSVAMYHLKETIGEANLNRALKSVVGKFAYSDGPYPTSTDLIEAIREQTPPEHYGLLADLFDHITLFENETTKAEYRKIDENNYEVTVDVNFKKLHAESDGLEKEVKFEDWIEIGAFSKPTSSNEFGKTLYRKRFLVTESNRKFTFTVNETPALAGVDPFALLIDRNTANNMREPTMLAE